MKRVCIVRSFPALLGLALVVALGACRTPQAPLLSPKAVVLDLPLVKQDELYQCGLASISALAEYWRKPLPSKLRAELAQRAIDERGLTGAELSAALDQLGLESFIFEGRLDRSNVGLFHHVDLARPLIVMTAPESGEHHHVLFLGYDPEQNLVVLLDPVRGRVLQSKEVFERTWTAAQHFTLLALPKSQEGERP